MPLRVLFLVEGYTDIRFVVGLSQICDLTMAAASQPYAESGLEERVKRSQAALQVAKVGAGRLSFQWRSLMYMLRHAREFDVILAQEVLRGAFNANLVGSIAGVPVVTYMGIDPVSYFRCRRERGQLGIVPALIGETVIRTLMTINGRLATRCLTMGPYLRDVARRHGRHAQIGLYYGVDTETFRPADQQERLDLRKKHSLPVDSFLIVLSSRISHEKDPETVLHAVALARRQGLNAIVLNLGGDYQEFLRLAKELGLPEAEQWVLGRPAAHPMHDLADYFRCADVLALASLAEGAAFSTLEALACGTPVVATAVGGMAVQLEGYARLSPRCDPPAMCQELLWVAGHPEQARNQALLGREYVVREWNRQRAFAELRQVLEEVCRRRQGQQRA